MFQKVSTATVAFIVLFGATHLRSRAEFFRLEDLRPGMKGIGKTCYRGSKPEDFQVEILGVMRGVGPGANAVLARFSGGTLAETGVFEGMSGSPVFIDGKLLGAVAFSFPFSKEAIGGITPITQMVDAFSENSEGPAMGPKVILKKSMLWNYRLTIPTGDHPSSSWLLSPRDISLQPALAPYAGHALVPIATPLALGGISAETLRMFAPQFRAMGFSVLPGSGSSGAQVGNQGKPSPASDSAPLEPGSNVVVPLVRGDLDASAGGTVTYIDTRLLKCRSTCHDRLG